MNYDYESSLGTNNKYPPKVSNRILRIKSNIASLKHRNKAIRKQYLDNQVKMALMGDELEEIYEKFNKAR